VGTGVSEFDELTFSNNVAQSLVHVKTILENTRYSLCVLLFLLTLSNPQYFGDVYHVYDDKFLLSEVLTTTTIAAQLNCLKALGRLRREY
jgi:hypothetical protein